MSHSRVVVACRLPGALRFVDRPKDALARFGALIERATVTGGAMAGTSFEGVAFSWDEARLEDAVNLATEAAHAPPGQEAAWACGIASGELYAAGLTTIDGPPPLEWGEPLAVASALARVARPREVLVDVSVPAVVSRELLTDRVRVGRVGGVRVRGYRVNARKPWRSLAAADVSRMVDPPLMARPEELAALMSRNGVIILRADSGFGGTRMLAEVAAKTLPSRSITLTPFAAVHEPLGSLRRAMAFVAATERITLPPGLHPVLDRLLGAQGITIDEAAQLIAHQIRTTPGAPPPSILLDDVTDLDEPSVDACARAMGLLDGAVRVVARIDSMAQLPRSLARFSDGTEVRLERLPPAACQAIAAACTDGALEAHACVQWARRGGGTPLGVIEAVAAGIVKGDLLWSGDVVAPLKRAAGEDIARPVGYWILRRAEDLKESSREVLVALAHLGGEASAGELFDVVKAVAPKIDLQAELVILRRARWIRQERSGAFCLMTRAQRESILESSRNEQANQWRIAVAKVLERVDGTLRRAEAAQHAARAGMGEWASRLAMAAARTAVQYGIEESASALAAFAGLQDPMSSDLDLGALPLDEAIDDPTAASGLDAIDMLLESDLDSIPPSSGDVASARFAAPVSYQGLLDAARDLKETRWADVARKTLVDGTADAVRCRGLLALARAYADEGNSSEALVLALDALARMREIHDIDGARTCLLFLARLYERTERLPDATLLKRAAAATV